MRVREGSVGQPGQGRTDLRALELGRALPRMAWLAIAAMALCAWRPASAAQLDVVVTGRGAVLPDAVVTLEGSKAVEASDARAVMDQRGSQFVPRVLAVQAGTQVSFPNSDQIQHQVYSFSPTKRFELPLYGGKSATPLRFDKPGVVVLGCNIHDWMIGYVVVVESPYFAVSDAQGRLRIDAPPGTYRVRGWHERLDGTQPEATVTLVAGKPATFALALPVSPAPPSRPGNDRLKALQDKFRKIKPTP